MKIKSVVFFGSIFFALWAMQSCQEKTNTSNADVASIQYDHILFEDGTKQILDKENIEKAYYLIRHAEKDTVPANDPGLTPAGVERANLVADIFRQTRIDAVYTTLYLRTLTTVDSLCRAKGISMKVYDPAELKAFAEQLKAESSEQATLVVGHSNTTPNLAGFLADLTEVEGLSEEDYDQLFIVLEKKDGSKELLRLPYGNG